MTTSDPATVGAATAFLRGLAACHQVAGLYPPEHPEYRDRATHAAVAARELHARAGELPLFLVRRGFYLGPTLLAQASLQHPQVLEAGTESGLVGIELLSPPPPEDVQLLVEVLRGDAPLSTPIATLRVNQVMPAVHGVDTSGSNRGGASQLAAAFLTSALETVGRGGPVDATVARSVGERLAGETMADPATALLLTALVGLGDDHLAAKSVKVAVLVPVLARLLRWTVGPSEELALAGLLHDVGMATVDEGIRTTHGPLSADARHALEVHPVEGAGLLLEAGLPGNVVEAALHHHRGVDGSGYPAHHTDPPPLGRIVAVADRYAALTTRRPYRAPAPPVEALQRVRSAPDLDPKVVDTLSRLLGTYPPGSLVRLDTDEIALVTAANRRLPSQPLVRVILDAAGEPAEPETRDLSTWDTMGFRWDVAGTVDPGRIGLDIDEVIAGTTGRAL